MPDLHSTTYSADNARTRIIIVHGYAEHSGRYDRIANILSDHGHEVITFDLRGYGRSDGSPAFVSSFDEYASDLATIIDDVHRDNHPLVLMGHSLGGLVILKTVLDGLSSPDALILSSPALAFHERRWLQRASSVIGRLWPRLPTVRLNRALISRDASVVGAAIADPLCYQGRIKARTGAEMVRAAIYISARMKRLEIPFLVIHGTGDGITRFQGSQRLYDTAGSRDKEIHLIKDAFHETLNDLCREEVESIVISWLDERF